MTTFSSCPRCAGQLYEDSDQHGRFLSCLSCGYLEPTDHYDPEGKKETRRPRGNYRTGRPRLRLRGQTAKQKHR